MGIVAPGRNQINSGIEPNTGVPQLQLKLFSLRHVAAQQATILTSSREQVKHPRDVRAGARGEEAPRDMHVRYDGELKVRSAEQGVPSIQGISTVVIPRVVRGGRVRRWRSR